MGKEKGFAEAMIKGVFSMVWKTSWKIGKKLLVKLIKLVWQLILLCIKLYLICFYMVSRLLVTGLTNINKAIEVMIYK